MPRTTAYLLAVLCPIAAADEKPRVYTNEDLDRVAPYRAQTGVLSQPAAPPETPRDRKPGKDSGGARNDERYWRDQADRTAEQVRKLREQAASLAERVDQLRRKPGARPYSDPRLVSLEERRRALESRAREAELRLEERARRAGALPGWLR
ncbi:MAG TPA: hypothetical protein VFQ51_06480 [Vicinamibacteria bacterium]|nr:hypothetical protein [Vicinamibacteria bacterium]